LLGKTAPPPGERERGREGGRERERERERERRGGKIKSRGEEGRRMVIILMVKLMGKIFK